MLKNWDCSDEVHGLNVYVGLQFKPDYEKLSGRAGGALITSYPV